MSVGIWFPGPWPDLNSYIDTERGSRYSGAELKRRYTGAAQQIARAAGVEVVPTPAIVRCTWHLKDRRKDPDNVSFAIKFLLDGLVAAGVIENDGQAQIAALHHEFVVAGEEGVLVELIAVETEGR